MNGIPPASLQGSAIVRTKTDAHMWYKVLSVGLVSTRYFFSTQVFSEKIPLSGQSGYLSSYIPADLKNTLLYCFLIQLLAKDFCGITKKKHMLYQR
jgi:hypothetical protein